MSAKVTLRQWFGETWKGLLGLSGVILVVVLLTTLAVASCSKPWLSPAAVWPERLSSQVPTSLPISLNDHDDVREEGARVELYRGLSSGVAHELPAESEDFEKVASGTLDAEGSTVLEIPPVEPLEGDGTETLVLHIETDHYEWWYEHSLKAADAPTMAITLDRPLYQPGQTMKMRGVVVSATTGKPIDGPLAWTIHDARGNLVFQKEAPTGANGVGSVEFTLADRCVQGTYEVTATFGEDRASATKSVDVRPFRLPRFTVDVLLDEQRVEPGAALHGRVEARYTYGEPVATADVSVAASAPNLQLTGAAGTTTDGGVYEFVVDVPPDADPGTPIDVTASVTSAAGRAESGSVSTRVAGRSISVEVFPASRAHFVWHESQTGYLVLSDDQGEPVSDTNVQLTLPEEGAERDAELTTDARGRAEFEWAPHPSAGDYLSVSFPLDGERIALNLHPVVDYGSHGLDVQTSVARVGDELTATVSNTSGDIVALVRDGVALDAQLVGEGDDRVTFEIPSASAGLAHIVLLGGGSRLDSLPIWIRQRGGDEVEISTYQKEYRPGKEMNIALSFPAPSGDIESEEPPVTFGLVGVDEALYALKERAEVPLHILLRRAPATIDAALRTFDGVESDDPPGVAIATSRFRQELRSADQDTLVRASDVSRAFRDHSRRPWLLSLLWVWLLGGLATLVQMTRWTWRTASREAFSLRRALAQLGFGVFAAIFAIALAAFGQGEAWAGGMAVWVAVLVCWWIAAAARLPELPFDRWLGAHLLGVAFIGAAGVCLDALSTISAPTEDWFMLGAVVVPLVLAGLQWFVWAFVLMQHGEHRSALGLASLLGIFTLGLGGFVMVLSGAKGEPAMMASKADMAERSIAPPPPPTDGTARQRGAETPEPAPDAKPSASASTGAQPRVRSWFPETMVWLPELPSDDQGRATVDVELPDSITTWRLDAWANSLDGRFGQGQASLRVVKPYFVELDVPTEVIEGDRFEVPLTLVNRTTEPLAVDFQARAEGALTLAGGRGDSTELQPRERRIVWLRLRARSVGEGSVTVSSTTDERSGDAVQRKLTVAPDGRTLRESTSGIIGEGFRDEILIPRAAIDGTALAEVRIFASLVADAVAGLSSMVRRPMGCFEQTSSVNYPNIMILRLLESTEPEQWPDGPDDWLETRERALEMVQLGYQRILTFQRPGGGFALYPDHDPDVMLTAYGILQLVWARDVVTVDDSALSRAANWLANQQNDNGGWPVERRGVAGTWRTSDDIGQVRSTSFAVLALLATGDDRWSPAVEKGLDRIEKRIVSVESPNALAFAANALAEGGRDKAAAAVVDRLANGVTRDGEVAFWEAKHPTWMGGRHIFASRETTAIAAQALLQTETQAELLQPVLNWISGERSAWGGWGSTQATVWTLRVLETLRERSSERSVLKFSYAGAPLETGVSEVIEQGPQPLRQFHFVPDAFEGVFDVEASAETTAMVQLVTEYAVGWESRHADLSGEPFGAALELEVRDLQRGKPVQALVRIENAEATRVNMAIVEAPVPPGAFVSSDSLDKLREAGKIDAYEILPTHVRFYVTTIPAETERVWAYEFVPLVAGTFSMPPVRAYPFYSPEPMTEVDGGDIRVE